MRNILYSAAAFILGFVLSHSAPAQEERPVIEVRTTADYLHLHVSGQAPLGTTAVQYRFAESGELASNAPWLAVETPIPIEGPFAWDLPLTRSRWSELQVRALKGEDVLALRRTRPAARKFVMLTPERIAALPAPERNAWTTYLTQSEERFEKEYDTLAAECRHLKAADSTPAAANSKEFESTAKQDTAWFGNTEAKGLTAAVLSFQTPSGGWSKAVDYTKGPRLPGTHWTISTGKPWHYCGTLDNRTTTEQIKFLSQVFVATKREDAKAAALRGIEWILAAQFPNGGWPQNYPVEPGYHEAITLNDGAMLHAMELLLAVSRGEEPFGFVDEAIRRRASVGFEKAVGCVLAAQVKVNGQPAVWCAQHDPLSFVPVAARLKEPPSLSGAESADLLRFLMRRGPVTVEMETAIRGGIAWLSAHQVKGMRKVTTAEGKTDFIADPTSTEVYWARFYNVDTGLPEFAGAQDGKIYSTFHEMAQSNKVAYDYFTTRPEDVIGKEMARWEKRLAKERR